MWNNNLFMTREQIRAYDKIAIEEIGIPGPLLMENAGLGAARVIQDSFDTAHSVAVIAGPGNNGGDGFVIARHLINAGYDVKTYFAHPREKIAGDARLNFDILEKMDGCLEDITTPDALSAAQPHINHRAVIVDALLGTGVSRPVEGHFASIIDAVNGCAAQRVAIDIPSGLDADTGAPMGRCIHADLTVTFGHLKRGLLLHPGADLAGRIHVVSIGAPEKVSAAAGIDGERLSEPLVASLIPTRKPDSHKGTFGHLMILGGISGKTGAAAMAGQSAMRVGTGLTTVVTTSAAAPSLEAKSLETMVDYLVDSESSPFTEEIARRLDVLLEGKRAVAVGPGLGTSDTMTAALRHIVNYVDIPLVIDADGLNILAAHPDILEKNRLQVVLTPHPGEMARLARVSVYDVQKDRIGIARATAARFDAVVVLKGAHTVIAIPDGRCFINPTGNAGMASGGMGDVLTGIIGGLLAQGLATVDAARAGVYLHGKAGDCAAAKCGLAGLLASDVIRHVPFVLKEWASQSHTTSAEQPKEV